VSVLWWTLFEVFNLRLGNWYYVMDPARRAVRWAGGVFAFATVLPGIVETLEMVENLGGLRHVKVRPLVWTPAKEAATLFLGVACVALPLAWPQLFYPLAWGAAVFLLEPWNRRYARRSFLRDLQEGEAGPFLRTLLAGLVCGALWESWNFWARTKWIYTVPGFERLKLFEMPLLGFLGFPPFAVESLVFVRFLGGMKDRLSAGARRAARAVALIAGPPAAIAFFAVIDPVVVDSVYQPVSRMQTVPADVRERLADAGLDTAERALRALDTAADRAELSARTGLPATVLLDARDRIALVLHRGLGDDRAAQLQRVGVTRVADLRRWSPEALAEALRAQGPRPKDRFLERRACIWIDGAATSPRSER
jgi:hypothetical protein